MDLRFRLRFHISSSPYSVGLSIAQHNPVHTAVSEDPLVVGSSNNLIEETNAVYNITPAKVRAAFEYYDARPLE